MYDNLLCISQVAALRSAPFSNINDFISDLQLVQIQELGQRVLAMWCAAAAGFLEVLRLQPICNKHPQSLESSIGNPCASINEVLTEYAEASNNVLEHICIAHSLAGCIVKHDLCSSLHVSNHSALVILLRCSLSGFKH